MKKKIDIDMTTEEQYKKFEELDKLASQGGGIERIEKQHANGHMTARERIDMLLDKGTFNELDKLVVHHCTDFGMDKKHIPVMVSYVDMVKLTDAWFMSMRTILPYSEGH